MSLKDPIALLIALQKILESTDDQHMAYGGLVLSLYGAPRFTRDADIAVSRAALDQVTKRIQAAFPLHHCALDVQPYGGLLFTRLTLLGEGDRDDFNSVDLVFPADEAYAVRALERQYVGSLRQVPVNIIAPEDFIIFKVLSAREVDLEDAKRVLQSMRGSLDFDLIEHEILALAQSTPQHSVLPRWRTLSQSIST